MGLPHLIIFSLVLLTVLVLLWRLHSKRKKTEDPAADLKPGSPVKLTYEGREYEYTYVKGDGNTPPYLKISVESVSNGDFEIEKRSFENAFFKAIGILRDFNTGDAGFDKQFFILTDSHTFTSSYFMERAKKDAVYRLFELGFDRIIHDGAVMECRWGRFKPKRDFNLSVINEALTHLSALIKEMPRAEAESAYIKPKNRALSPQGTVFAVIILFCLATAGLWWGLREYPPLDSINMFLGSLWYSIPAFAAFLWLTALIVRGKAKSHEMFKIIVLLSIIFFPVCGFGTFLNVNGYLDKSESSVHRMKVESKRKSTSKGRVSHYVSFKSWRKGRDFEKIKIKSEDYERVKPGVTQMAVETKPGRLGYEWVSSYSIE